jgi:hypothetical protein
MWEACFLKQISPLCQELKFGMSCTKQTSNTSTTITVRDLLAIPTQLTIVINALEPEVYLTTLYISSSYLTKYTMCLYYNYHLPNVVQWNTCCLLRESYKTCKCTKWAKSRVSECQSRWYVTLGVKRFKEFNFEMSSHTLSQGNQAVYINQQSITGTKWKQKHTAVPQHAK